MTTMVEAALERWDGLRHTHALRSVDAERIADEARGAPDGPLTGLLFSVKDLLPVGGVESCAGSLVLAGNVPTSDPPLVAAARAAGAVVFGKGVCAEFGFGVDTVNRLDGVVSHHADPMVSPGGSSGGDAVAVGSGVVDFAVAGDYGGSVRWPAQATGVLGLRLGIGRTPVSGRLGAPSGQQARLEVPGVLARNPTVLAAVTGVLTGPPPDIRPARRLLVADPAALGSVDGAVVAAIESTVSAAHRTGYAVSDAPASFSAVLAAAFAVYRRLRELTDTHDGVRALVAGRTELLCDSTRVVLREAQVSTATADPAEIADLRRRGDDLAAQVRAMLDGTDALLLPVAATGAIGLGERVELRGAAHDATSLQAHLRAISLTGLPALALPVAERVSVQLVGPDGAELLLCALARDIAR